MYKYPSGQRGKVQGLLHIVASQVRILPYTLLIKNMDDIKMTEKKKYTLEDENKLLKQALRESLQAEGDGCLIETLDELFDLKYDEILNKDIMLL